MGELRLGSGWPSTTKKKATRFGGEGENAHYIAYCLASSGSMVKNPPAVWKMQVRSLGQEDPLEKDMATHSSILAWEIPWTGEPGGLQSMGSQESDMTERLNHDWFSVQSGALPRTDTTLVRMLRNGHKLGPSQATLDLWSYSSREEMLRFWDYGHGVAGKGRKANKETWFPWIF